MFNINYRFCRIMDFAAMTKPIYAVGINPAQLKLVYFLDVLIYPLQYFLRHPFHAKFQMDEDLF